ncbi:MAG: hypothetical protein ACWGNB_01600 [Thiogranum sp.]
MKYLHRLFLIEEEETGTAVYFLILLLVIGSGMALGRATANALFLKRTGIDYLPLLYLAQGGASFLASLFYAAIADLIPAERFFKALFASLAGLVLAFWLLVSLTGHALLFPAYFLFYEIVSEILLIHSALYLNQNLNTIQAKRLSPVILSGLQIGTILGGLFLATSAPVLGTYNIMLVWALLLILALVMISLRHKRQGPSPYFRTARQSGRDVRRMTAQIRQGFRFARGSELLRLAMIAMVFMVITYYIINYSVKRVYTESYASEDALTAFFGVLTLSTSGLALLVQLFVTNRLIRRFGVPTVNLFYPLASLISFIGMIFHLGLPSAVAASVNIESVMPAFYNPVQTIFLNVLPQHIQGRARAMSLAIVLPISLCVCGAALWVLQDYDNPSYFLAPGALAAAFFVYFSIRMNRAYGATLLTHLKEHLFLPGEQSAMSLRHTGKDNVEVIADSVSRGDEASVCFARILAEIDPEMATNRILALMDRTTPKIADQLIKVASTTGDDAVYRFLLERPRLHDNHFQATTLKILGSARVEEAIPLVHKALDDPDPRTQVTAIRAVLSWPLEDFQTTAIANWLSLLDGSDKQRLAALELIPDISRLPSAADRERVEQACLVTIADIYAAQSPPARARILDAFSHWQGASDPEIEGLIARAIEDTDPDVRSAAVRCIELLPQDQRTARLESALADGHALVRNAALAHLRERVPNPTELVLNWITEDNRGTPRAQNTLLSSLIESGLPADTLESIVENKIRDARQIHTALATVRQHLDVNNKPLKLLRHLLEERFQQILDIALTAMEPLCARGIIAIIRGGIRTGDDRYIANACEALHSIPNRALAQTVGQLIQDAFMPARKKDMAGAAGLEVMLETLAARHDPWLQECAVAALATARGTGSG